MEQPSPSREQPKNLTYKYCIVPNCKNSIRNARHKVFFPFPKSEDIRRKWCKIIKIDMVPSSTYLYCCEDHFDIEKDTENFKKYQYMNLQEQKKTILRLKKGILPHKFQCQKDNNSQPLRESVLMRKHLVILQTALSVNPAKQNLSASNSSSENNLEANSIVHQSPMSWAASYLPSDKTASPTATS